MKDEFLVKYLLHELEPGERRMVEDWIRAHPDNQGYFNQFKQIWEESTRLSIVGAVNEEAAWQKFRTRIHQPVAAVRKTYAFPWMRIAALFIVIAGLVWLSSRFFGSRSLPVVEARTLNNVLKDTLPDGSFITLNKNSVVTYPRQFKGKARRVQLSGEAFFEVVANKEQPFIINVNDLQVEVVGTSFNIRSGKDATEVIVESGIVRVTRHNKVVELRANEKLVAGRTDSSLQKTIETEELYNYYLSKEFVCDGTPLWKLVEVLNEAYGVDIIIERKELRSLPLTATFSNESLDHILEIIRMTFHLTIIKSGNQIIIR